jgi:hypothetical protein
MNLMRKCVQIKDELGQMYTYLLKKLVDCFIYRLNFIQWPCTVFFSLAGEAAYIALPVM